MKLLVATRNPGKVRELSRLFAELEGVTVVGLDALSTPPPEVVEDADTIEGNAIKKAAELARASGLPTLADDSGLEVDALEGAPGVSSARYAGVHGDDEANNRKLLRELEGVSDRRARFRCALAFADPSGLLGERVHVEHGVLEGSILEAPRGEGGFGYDPLFLPEGESRSAAELSPEEKNAISHRAAAARKMCVFLRGYVRR